MSIFNKKKPPQAPDVNHGISDAESMQNEGGMKPTTVIESNTIKKPPQKPQTKPSYS